MTAAEDAPLLDRDDPVPVEWLPAAATTPFVLACEHAGRAVPRRLGDLGVAAADMDRHIAFDVGAEGLARGLAARLGASLVLQRYSRLVIDCNRPHAAPDLIPPVSDGTAIAANAGISSAERALRWAAIHHPFHGRLSQLLDDVEEPVLVAVHSFTRRLRNGPERPWQAGFLFNRDRRFATALMTALAGLEPGLCLALNQPYAVDDLSDYTIPVHGEGRGIPHVLLEVRNDLIAGPAGQQRWAELLARALPVAHAMRMLPA